MYQSILKPARSWHAFGPSLLLGAILCLLGAVPAASGVADSPLPKLGGQSSKHVFSVTGVLHNDVFVTRFICSSLEKRKEIRMGVEVFAPDGGDPLNTVVHTALPVGTPTRTPPAWSPAWG